MIIQRLFALTLASGCALAAIFTSTMAIAEIRYFKCTVSNMPNFSHNAYLEIDYVSHTVGVRSDTGGRWQYQAQFSDSTIEWVESSRMSSTGHWNAVFDRYSGVFKEGRIEYRCGETKKPQTKY